MPIKTYSVQKHKEMIALEKTVKKEVKKRKTKKEKQRYLDLEFLPSFPASKTRDQIVGTLVKNDEGGITQGIIIDAKKEGKPDKHGIQRWRAVARITDEKLLNAFEKVPGFKKKIKTL